jgi:hypothetical protein
MLGRLTADDTLLSKLRQLEEDLRFLGPAVSPRSTGGHRPG